MQSREERLEEKLCEKKSLFCSFSPFVMGKLFLRKVKFYLRNVTDARVVPAQWKGSTDDIAPEWLAWIERWRQHSSLQSTEHVYYRLLKVGRWLKAHHPEVV